MSSFTKKTLITLLFVTSNVSAFSNVLPGPTPPMLDPSVQNFMSHENLSWITFEQSQLNFKNEGDYSITIDLNYKRRNSSTKKYDSKNESITLKKGEKKSLLLNGDDAFVNISGRTLPAETAGHNDFNFALCSYNNKYFNYNESSIKNQKDITFTGTKYEMKVTFPDLSKKGYSPLNLIDIECWNTTPPKELRVYEDIDLKGDFTYLNDNVPNLKNFNNKISSYAIPRDWTVTFYEEKNYKGKFYTRSVSYDTDLDINDKIKSLKIEKKF